MLYLTAILLRSIAAGEFYCLGMVVYAIAARMMNAIVFKENQWTMWNKKKYINIFAILK